MGGGGGISLKQAVPEVQVPVLDLEGVLALCAPNLYLAQYALAVFLDVIDTDGQGRQTRTGNTHLPCQIPANKQEFRKSKHFCRVIFHFIKFH